MGFIFLFFVGGGPEGSKFSKSRRGVIEIKIYFDMGEGGVKKPEKNSDVFYGQTLTKRAINQSHFRQKGNHIGVRRGIEQKMMVYKCRGSKTCLGCITVFFFKT